MNKIKNKLKKYKNRFRILIIYTDKYTNDEYIKSKEAYKKYNKVS